MTSDVAAKVAELRQAISDTNPVCGLWNNAKLLVLAVLTRKHLPEILDALESAPTESGARNMGAALSAAVESELAQQAEIERLKAALGPYKAQAEAEISKLKAALAEAEKRAVDQRAEHCQERLALIRNRSQQIAALTQERDAAIAALNNLIEAIAVREESEGERFHPSILHACAVGEAAIRAAREVKP